MAIVAFFFIFQCMVLWFQQATRFSYYLQGLMDALHCNPKSVVLSADELPKVNELPLVEVCFWVEIFVLFWVGLCWLFGVGCWFWVGLVWVLVGLLCLLLATHNF